MIELWRRKVWHNSKTVNCVVSACFSKHTKLLLPSLNFFLGNCTFYDEDEMNLDEELMQERLQQAHQHKRAAKFSGKTKKYDREVKRAQTKVKSLAMKGQEEYKSGYDAIQLIYDPHQFAARLFTKVKQAHEKFDTRLFMLNVTSRVISGHKLMLENFYPYMQKYMKPHQNDVIKVLTYTAQACHELVSPDVLQPVVRTLANNFVTDRTRGEVMQIGINAICEITKRCPLAMTAEMLADLIQYRKNKHKGVVVAARALLHTFREINPLLLPKKERGRDEAMAVQRGEREQLEYGEAKTHTNFLGAELYRKYLEDKALRQKYNLGSDDDIPAEATLEDSENDDEVPELVPAGQEGKATSSADAAASGQKRKKPTPSKDDAKQGAKVATPFSHILTPEDYEKIEEYRMKRLANPKKFAKQETLSMQLILERFTGDSDDSDRDERHAYSIDTDMIQGYQKKKKMTKKDRMIHHAAQDRSQFGYNSKKTNGASMTNAQKEKSTKVFAMTKRSRKVRHKSNGSMHEKKNKAKTLKTMIKNQKVLAKKARKRLKK
jgi:protein SDA1